MVWARDACIACVYRPGRRPARPPARARPTSSSPAPTSVGTFAHWGGLATRPPRYPSPSLRARKSSRLRVRPLESLRLKGSDPEPARASWTGGSLAWCPVPRRFSSANRAGQGRLATSVVARRPTRFVLDRGRRATSGQDRSPSRSRPSVGGLCGTPLAARFSPPVGAGEGRSPRPAVAWAKKARTRPNQRRDLRPPASSAPAASPTGGRYPSPALRARKSSVTSLKPLRRTSPMRSNSRCGPADSTTGRVTRTSPPAARAATRDAWLTSRPK